MTGYSEVGNGHPFIEIQKLHELCEAERQENAQKHKHNFYSAYLITQGQVIYKTNYVQHCLGSEMLLFVSKGVVHKMEFSPDIKGYSIIFNDLFWSMFANSGIFEVDQLFNREDFKTTLRISTKNTQQFNELIQDMLHEQNTKEKGMFAMLHHYLSIFLLKVHRIMEPDLTTKPEEQEVQQARTIIRFRQLIDKNYRQAKTVSAYAEKLNLSPNCLNELSKNISGTTAGELIRNRVIQEAQKMLLTSNLSFKEIAYNLGFEDPAYFSRYFKKYTGKTMKAFRQLNMKLSN